MCARLAPAASRVASRRLVRPRLPAAAVARHSLSRQAAGRQSRAPPQLGESGYVQVAVQRLKGLRACTLISAGCAGCTRTL